MKLNDALNLVVPLRDEQKALHTPISREDFEANYRLHATTRPHHAAEGVYYQMDSGPRISAMILRDKAKAEAVAWGDPQPGESKANALFAEIKRLTTILAPTPNGWEALPIDAAIQAQHLDAEEWEETLSAIVFFTCHYALGRKAERPRIAEATASLLKASVTPLSLSEYASSLPKLTQAATSSKAASSVPA